MITVTRRYRFNASHRLHSSAFSNQQNAKLFGKCNNPFGHGHNYEIEVTVRGEIESKSGRVVDIARLDDLVDRTILQRYDHRNLNAELPEFETAVPTTENLGQQIDQRLTAAWPAAFAAFERVRIFETDRNMIEVVHENPYETR